MNHPLPKSGSKMSMPYEFVDAEADAAVDAQGEQLQAETPRATQQQEVPMRRLRDTVIIPPDSDDPYEAYRQRILRTQAEQAEYVRQAMPPLPARGLNPEALDQLRQRNYFYDPQQYYSRSIDAAAAPAPEPFFQHGLLNRGVALASLVAVLAGCALGFALTKKEQIGASATRTLAYVGSFLPADQPTRIAPPPQPAGQSSTVIAKKPIATASLNVSDVSGSINSPIALPLRADPAFQNQDLSIRISGLPEDAVLSAGKKISDQTWLLNDEDLADVRLVVPHAEAPSFDLSVAAIETSTGELAAPVREMKLALTGFTAPAAPQMAAQPATGQSVIQQTAMPAAQAATPAPQVQVIPANAPPESATAPAAPAAPAVASPVPAPSAATIVKPQLSPEVQGMLQKGDVLLKSGDLVMARQFYLRASDLGAAEGALGVARTYDPAVFKDLNVQGIVPDVRQAEDWYRKASLTGLPEAVDALTRFETTAALPQ